MLEFLFTSEELELIKTGPRSARMTIRLECSCKAHLTSLAPLWRDYRRAIMTWNTERHKRKEAIQYLQGLKAQIDSLKETIRKIVLA